jgi:hypothetical protein
MEKLFDINKLESIRKNLKNRNFRKKYWEKNKQECRKNTYIVFDYLRKKWKIKKKWKIHLLVSKFVLESESKIAPYNYNSFSLTNLIGASPKQGYEIVIFLNKARIGFASLPALIPIIAHEMYHIKQIDRNLKQYNNSFLNDNLSNILEKEADKAVFSITNINEFRKQEILESILYCYDNFGGWTGSKKMADFWFKKIEKIYGGGYTKNMTPKEYNVFLNAMKKNKINLFINHFIKN